MIPEEDLLQLKDKLGYLCSNNPNNIEEHKLQLKDIYYVNNVDYVECSFERFHKIDLDRSFKKMYNYCKGLWEDKKFIVLLDKYVYSKSRYGFYIDAGLFIIFAHLYKTYEDFDLEEYSTYIANSSSENLVFITNVDSNYYIDDSSQCCNYIRRIATEKFVDNGTVLVDIFDFLDSDGNVVISLPYFCTNNDTSSYDERVKILQKILMFTHKDNLEILCAAQCKYNVKEYKLIEAWRRKED